MSLIWPVKGTATLINIVTNISYGDLNIDQKVCYWMSSFMRNVRDFNLDPQISGKAFLSLQP